MFRSRSIAMMMLATAALFVAGCGSNNKDKIVGKWKIVTAPGFDQQVKMLETFQAFVYFEFKADGTMAIGAGSTNPEFDKEIAGKISSNPDIPKGTYKLQSGDNVEFAGMGGGKGGGGLFGKDGTSRVKIKIDGDNMTITGSDGTGTLTRMK